MEQHRDEDAGDVDAIDGEDTPEDHLPRTPEPVRQHGGSLPSGHAPILHPGELGVEAEDVRTGDETPTADGPAAAGGEVEVKVPWLDERGRWEMINGKYQKPVP
eukprot:6994298-Alexandrium_andersonii.AAC.1